MASAFNIPRWRRLLAWCALLLAAIAGGAWWWAIGRPVPLPDAPSARIACVSYAPFRLKGESPLNPDAFVSPQRMDADLRALSQRFDCVRTYSQGQGLSAVPAIAGRYGMKVLLGIWLGSDLRANAEQIKLGIATARAHPEVLRGIVVGNEVLLRGELSSAQIAGYLHDVRAAVPSVPVTYADVWEFWLRHPELADSVDFVTIHILPYWEDKPVPPDNAVEHVAAVYGEVKRAFPGHPVMIGETGWPSAGRPRQTASASRVNEALYLREFLRYAATVSMPYNVIEAFDQPWKRVQEGTAGGYWGIFDVHAKPKFPMQGPVVEEPDNWAGLAAGLLGTCVFMLAGTWRRHWHGVRGWLALALAGFATGCALAWQARQMAYGCSGRFEWSIATVACVLALLTTLQLARRIASSLGGIQAVAAPLRLRFGWLFALAYYGVLMVFDGRYRDFPLGLFEPVCAGYALAGLICTHDRLRKPMLEERFLAAWLPLLGLIVLWQEAWLSPVAWLWFGLNAALAMPVLFAWRRAGKLHRLHPQQG